MYGFNPALLITNSGAKVIKSEKCNKNVMIVQKAIFYENANYFNSLDFIYEKLKILSFVNNIRITIPNVQL